MEEPKASIPRDPESWGAQLRKGSLELAILATLWHEARYGLDILRAMKTSGLAVAEGTLYAILNRLRSEGLVVSEWRDAGSGHPRKYFTLTKSGRGTAVTMARTWKEFSRQIDNVLQVLEEVTHGKAK
jgi:PadR family transcriptional regulator PadR